MRWRFSFTSFQSSASGGAGLRSTMGFHTLESSALSAVKSFCAAGTSSSAKIASTGHSATQSVQSMHSSGSMTSMFGPSRKQSTGQTSTQWVYLHFTQDSVTTYVMNPLPESPLGERKKSVILAPGHGPPNPRLCPPTRFWSTMDACSPPVHPRTLLQGATPSDTRKTSGRDPSDTRKPSGRENHSHHG